jgi:hypothetical protein
VQVQAVMSGSTSSGRRNCENDVMGHLRTFGTE